MHADPPVTDRFLPPEPRTGGGGACTRWIVTLIALAVLGVVAYKGYSWFTDDVGRRETLAAAGKEPEPVTVPPPVEVEGLAQQADGVPDSAAPVAELGDINDPDQRRAVCAYLAAEQQRLDHEFKQPLPPPVVDRIATEITQLHAQTGRAGCAPGNAETGHHAVVTAD